MMQPLFVGDLGSLDLFRFFNSSVFIITVAYFLIPSSI